MFTIPLLTLIGVGSMLVSMGIQVAIAYYLGAGAERDSLFVAMSVPIFLNSLLISTIGVVVTPAVLVHKSRGKQHSVALLTALCVVGLTSLATLVLFLTRSRLVSVLAPGFSGDSSHLTQNLFGYSLWLLPIQGAAGVMSGYFIAHHRVLLPGIALAIGLLVTLAFLVTVGSHLHAESAIIAMIAGAVVTFLIQAVPFAANRQIDAEETIHHSKTIQHLSLKTMPLIFSGLVSRSSPLIERNLASSMGTGTISCLGYAGYLLSFLVNATATPTATAYFPKMCTLWKDGCIEEVGDILRRTLVSIASISLGIVGAFLLVGAPLLEFTLKHTRISPPAIDQVVHFSNILMIAYVFLACGGLLSKMFYVTGASMAMAALDSLGAMAYVLSAIVLSNLLGASGLAIATGVQAFACLFLFYAWSAKKLGHAWAKSNMRTIGFIALIWTAVLGSSLFARYLIAETFGPLIAASFAILIYLALLLPVARFAYNQSRIRATLNSGPGNIQ